MGDPPPSHAQIPASPWQRIPQPWHQGGELSRHGKEMAYATDVTASQSQLKTAIVVDEEEGKLPQLPVGAQGLLQPHTSCLPQAPKMKQHPRHCCMPPHNNFKAWSRAPQQRAFCASALVLVNNAPKRRRELTQRFSFCLPSSHLLHHVQHPPPCSSPFLGPDLAFKL